MVIWHLCAPQSTQVVFGAPVGIEVDAGVNVFFGSKYMTKQVFLVSICLAFSCTGLAVPNPEIAEEARIAQAMQSSKYIFRARISKTILSNTSSRAPILQVEADVEILSVIRSSPGDRIDNRARLLYTVDEAGERRAWKEYRRKAKTEGYSGPAPETGLPRVKVGDLVTVYAVDSNQTAFLEPVHIELEERGVQKEVSIGQSLVLKKDEWASVQLPADGETVELLYLGVGRSHCPEGPNGERGGLCATVRTQLLRNGRLIDFQNYPTTPPTRLVGGLSVQAMLIRGNTSESGVELRVIGQNEWQELWTADPQDSFSYGCGGGITGGYSKTEILRNGRITEVASPTFSGQQLSVSVETGQHQIADLIFDLLESIDPSQIDMDAPRENYSCTYGVHLGATSLSFLVSDRNPPDIRLALQEAQKALINKDHRVVNSL